MIVNEIINKSKMLMKMIYIFCGVAGNVCSGQCVYGMPNNLPPHLSGINNPHPGFLKTSFTDLERLFHEMYPHQKPRLPTQILPQEDSVLSLENLRDGIDSDRDFRAESFLDEDSPSPWSHQRGEVTKKERGLDSLPIASTHKNEVLQKNDIIKKQNDIIKKITALVQSESYAENRAPLNHTPFTGNAIPIVHQKNNYQEEHVKNNILNDHQKNEKEFRNIVININNNNATDGSSIKQAENKPEQYQEQEKRVPSAQKATPLKQEPAPTLPKPAKKKSTVSKALKNQKRNKKGRK